jgi:hypothetical protein
MVQGWNMLTPQETAPIAAVWDRQLERHDVPEQLFDVLLDRAVDARLSALARGDAIPAFSVELILQVFAKYRTEHVESSESRYEQYLRENA